MIHPSRETLEAGLDEILRSPRNEGRLELIVARPAPGERLALDSGVLDLDAGLVGDNWLARGFRKSPDGSAHPDMQLNIMSARVIALLEPDRSRWPLAGDQLYLDMDLSEANLPAGTRLALGEAEIEITAEPHNGCKKFASRFGNDATRFVNTAVGKELHLRGLNAKVIRGGRIRTGDRASKL